jgi:site-specific DNA-cytosine methylase
MWFTKSRRAQNDQDYETWIVGGVSPTLNAFDNAHETRATVLIIDGTRVDDVRIYDDGLTPCLKNRMGTGGNNVPFIATDPVLAFDGYNQSVTENVYRALRIGIDSGDHVAIPIQDGRDMEKKQNGLGIGEEGDTMYTLDQTGAQSVEHMMQVRRLTPIECERLMGWPDNHTATGTNGPVSDTNRYKMCGNGVASPVAEWIGQHLMAIPMLNKAHPDAE